MLRERRFNISKTMNSGPILGTQEGFKVQHCFTDIGNILKSLLKNYNAKMCEITMLEFLDVQTVTPGLKLLP